MVQALLVEADGSDALIQRNDSLSVTYEESVPRVHLSGLVEEEFLLILQL